jgi:uncharacterized membrane protein YqhA
MFGLLYRLLPGPRWVRAAVVTLVVLGLIVYLFGWGFEALSGMLPGLFDGDVLNPRRALDPHG